MTVVPRPALTNTFRGTLKINGEDFGVWDSKTGGEVATSQNEPYKTGELGQSIAMGGTTATSNIVLQKWYDLDDIHPRLQKLINWAGKGAAVYSQLPLDEDGIANPPPIVHKGRLTRVAPPGHDSVTADMAKIELEITIDGLPTAI